MGSTGMWGALASTATLLGDGGDFGLSSRIRIQDVPPNGPVDERVRNLVGAYAVVAGAETYTAELLDRLPQLCLIARSGVGFDQIDLETASRLGIHVTTTPGVNAHGVAEHTVTLLLSVTHRVAYYDARVRNGEWRDGEFFPEIQGMTVGIIGFGHIGRATAALLHAFGAQIIAFDVMPIRDAPDYVTVTTSIAEMLPRCQAISLHTPLLDSTRGLIGGDQLALLPRGSFVINAARGGIIDESALASALRSGHIAGAGLDVFAKEPPASDNPLLSIDSCVFSPHSASLGARTIERMTRMIVTQLNSVADGATPAGLVNAPAHPRFPLPVG
jgi:D-3-phosphoglycerate dehydrogenase